MPRPVVRGRRFSVIGGARSGLAVAGLLRREGAQVFVSEKSPEESLGGLRTELDRLGVPSEFGGHTERVHDADMLVVSPGVPSDAPVVREAAARGQEIVSELEVASWFSRGPIVAITGTNGKTTTTSLAGRMLSDAKVPAVVAGNIGTAFSQVVGSMEEGSVAVLEVSSFQLDRVRTFRPRVAVILNITPDHLDRYDHSFEKYIASKCRVFENQSSGDTLVYNLDDGVTRDAVERLAPKGVRLLGFTRGDHGGEGASVQDGMVMLRLDGRSTALIAAEAISIRGAHNLSNAMAAGLAARVMGVPPASLRATLKNFRGVEHRLEFVRELDGVMYVNDSKGTNVDAVWYALQSYSQPIVLLLGGRDKGNDYTRIASLVRDRVRAVIAIGESASTVRSAFEAIVPVTTARSMDEAVAAARSRAKSGDVVLLSPACASFDWFRNYEHRGEVFKQLVMALT